MVITEGLEELIAKWQAYMISLRQQENEAARDCDWTRAGHARHELQVVARLLAQAREVLVRARRGRA